MQNALRWHNPFHADLYRKGKFVDRFFGMNGVTDAGVAALLDTFFGNTTPLTQVNPWYIGLINNSPAPVLADADTLASHAGWVETSAYSGGNRLAWVDANTASRVKGTTTVATFTMTSDVDVYGILVASVASGTSGVLWATGAFSSPLSLLTADELKVTYAVRA